jgi:pimeloyl-ACP methyl ester carboxylesterase
LSEDAQRIDVGGHRLRARVAGAGETVFLCLHGLVDRLEVWDGLVPHLARMGRVVAFDQRAHGASDAPAGPYRREDLAADVVGLLDCLQAPRAVLVAHSMGGVVALTTALDHPDRVAGLVLIGTASQCNERTARWYEEIARAGEVNALDGIARAIYGPTSTRQVEGDAPGLVHVVRTLATLHPDPITPRLTEIRCPALVVVGDRDPMGTAASSIIAQRIPGAVLEVMPGLGHWVHRDAPDALAQAIDRWRSGVRSP